MLKSRGGGMHHSLLSPGTRDFTCIKSECPTQARIHPCHMVTTLSRETRKALFYHAKPRSGNHGGDTLCGKTKLFWSPRRIWPPCDKGEWGGAGVSNDWCIISLPHLREPGILLLSFQ